MQNQGHDRNRKGREANLGQSGNEINSPTGTSGRENRENWQGGSEGSRQGEGRRRSPAQEDDESLLGNRNSNR